VIAGCAGSGEPRQELEEYLKQCTASHGYNPEAAAALGPHELGAGELQWRECAYRKVETDLAFHLTAKRSAALSLSLSRGWKQFKIDRCQCSGDVDGIRESCLKVGKRFPAALGFQMRLNDFHAARDLNTSILL
jgi:hypothetical protein